MVQRIKDYLFRKFVADVSAMLLLFTAWFLLPAMILWAFNQNVWWVGMVWDQATPYLPTRLWAMGEALSAAHDALLKGLRFSTTWIGAAEDPGLEVGARTMLLGEAWILKVQTSWALRFLYKILG